MIRKLSAGQVISLSGAGDWGIVIYVESQYALVWWSISEYETSDSLADSGCSRRWCSAHESVNEYLGSDVTWLRRNAILCLPNPSDDRRASARPVNQVVGLRENYSTWASMAQEFAEKYHWGQFRRDGITPYIFHPAAIAQCFESDYARAVAWLHDVLEDTDADIGDLASVFPAEIVDAVMAITKRDGQPYDDYLKQVDANPLAKLVKIQDIKHNLSDQPTEKQIMKYNIALRFLERPNAALTGGEAVPSNGVVGTLDRKDGVR